MSLVRVGILHSVSGTMAISEAPLIDAALMAIAEINQTGGVLGKLIEPIIEDGASNPTEFESKARKLIQHDQVSTIFGCWTSASRKAVLPVFEQLNALLWYPVQYEGLECSKNIFYTGSCPNQQVEPAVNWLLQNKGKRFYLLGSDYVFPRTVNKLIKAQVKQQGGTVIGEDYVALGAKEFTEIIAKIEQARPDVVFNTLNGDSNIAFYRQYKDSGITASEIPILAVSVAEAELQSIGEAAADHYACWSYFQSLDTKSNHRFIQNFQARYGANRVTSDTIEAAYTQVYLWKQAVELAQSFEVERVRVAAYGQSFDAPGGLVSIEPNHHVGKACRIGRILPTGQFEIVAGSNDLIKPLPWLGIEELKVGSLKVEGLNQSSNPQAAKEQPATSEVLLPYSPDVVIDMLAEVSQEIHKAWQLEQKSRELEAAKAQLQCEIMQFQRVEAVLRDSEAELYALFAAMTDLVLVIDARGRYLKIAPTKLELLYKPAQELIGKTLHEVFEQAKADTFVSYIRDSLEAQQTVNFEYSLIIQEREVWFSTSISPLSEDSVIWVARDITERKQGEEALRASEERFRATFEQAGVGITHVGLDGRFLHPNPRFCEIVGFCETELLNLTFAEITYPDDLTPIKRFKDQLLADEIRTYSVEKRYLRSDGSIVWVHLTESLVRKLSGEPAYFLKVVEDISDRKQTEQALRESEQKYRLLFSSELDAISIFDIDTGQFLDANNSFLKLYGYTREQALNLTPALVSAEPENTNAAIQRASLEGGGHILQRWHKKKDGTVFPVELCAGTFHWKGRQVMCAVARDITNRKQAEAALRETEARFRAAAEGSLDAFFIYKSLRDETGRIIDFTFTDLNSKGEKMISMSKDEVIGKRMCELLPINRTGGFFEKYVKVVETGIPLEEEFPISTPEVTASWLQHQVVPLSDGIAITSRDISERKLSQEALKESEARLRLALEAAQMGTWDWNIVTNEVVYCEQLGPVFGLPRGTHHATSEAFLNSVHPEDREYVQEAVTRAIEEGTDYAVEFRVVWPDGTLHWVGNKGQVYCDETGKPIRMVGVAMNISDRKQAEEALRQSEERMRGLVNAIPDKMFRHQVDGTYLDVKAKDSELIVPAQNLIGRNLRDLPMHEEVKSRLLELIRTAVETGELQTYEHELELPDGVNSYEARIVKSGADEAVCIVRDITERKQAEEALRQQKELLQTIFDHIPVMVAFYDVTGQIQLLNREVERVLGWSIAELQDRDLLSECYPDPEYRQKVFDFMLASAGKWQDFKTKTRYGRTLDTSWANIQLSDGKSIGIGQDISDRKQAEEARRKAEQRYHSIFENSDKGLFQMTPDGRYVSANPALARIYGYSSPEELMASLTNINQQLYLDSNRRAQFLARMQADDRVSDFEAQIYRKDGNIIWILENAHVVRDAQGELLYYEGSVVDVTERKVWEEALRYQQECTEQLLLNILPSPIAERLKRAESIIADSFANVTVLFADLVDFTEFSAQIPPTKLLDLLNKIFSKFDQLSEKHGLEKIKTIGDAYMVVGGLPTPKTDHAEAIAEMALEMQREIDRFRRLDGQPMSLRIGIHSGPVVAGVIGMKKFAYDLWGDTVNVASRMESLGVAGRIQVTAETYELLKDKYCVEKRGAIFVKGKGEMITYWLTGRKICNLNTSYEVKDEV